MRDEVVTANLIFAPVLITTLSRYKHLTLCLNSLENCVGASCTDVYVALDYPSKAEHWDGYNKIIEYLRRKEKNNIFKSLNIIKREKNYGFGINGNSSSARESILHEYDSYIFSEDDNVFSPNFLIYINKGLKKFYDDKSVLAICGYRHFYNIRNGSNTFFRQNVDFSAWGYATWKDRAQRWSLIDENYFRDRLSLSSFIRVLKNGNNRALQLLEYAKWKEKHPITDEVLSVYAAINNYDIIMPSKVSLVRNLGFDGSGIHCGYSDNLNKVHSHQDISSDRDFDYIGNGYEFYKTNKRIYRTSSYGKIPTRYMIKYLMHYMLKYSFLKKILSK